ncbi:unnamed protein product [Rotaria sp. Silwood1]|nr:unnamed protein product [Rotaria sp. Silwood1]CAF1229803.1 unnamed protein product [Rotaria sp. Silwood1]CAF3488014.1 unnamed protein product [Rotaria sp. Silwood1]CAF3491214.1 unnamed protein product [Rotaria sp. Silwood1]CAF4536359.1 unnamed protein product [Rotaria sp. Silwood1]
MNPNEYPQPSAPPPPSYYESVNENRQLDSDLHSTRNDSESRDNYMTNFNKFVNRYEISRAFAERLHSLRGYEIVFICDDSGSMTAPIGEMNDPFGNQMTRWDELKRTVSIVVDLASVFDPDGIDVYFLNREPIFHVRDSSELDNLFAVAPEATDGIPTDERERPDIHTLEHVLKNERKPTNQIPVTIIICTDDNQSMKYLHDWDKMMPNLDVVADYRNEKKEIQMCRGKDFPFSFGDYIVKILMGGIDTWLDNCNEKK